MKHRVTSIASVCLLVSAFGITLCAASFAVLGVSLAAVGQFVVWVVGL